MSPADRREEQRELTESVIIKHERNLRLSQKALLGHFENAGEA